MGPPLWADETFDLCQHAGPRVEVAPSPVAREEDELLHVALLIGAAVAIYLACEWFVNAVEWLGVELEVGRIAVGTLLAAVGTALPESVVTFVAVVFRHSQRSHDIGVGAALGGPLVLSTIAYALVGFALLGRRRSLYLSGDARREATSARQRSADGGSGDGGSGDGGVDGGRLTRDQKWFLAVFVFKVALGLVAFAYKRWLGIAFFLAYGVYFAGELTDRGAAADSAGLEPLRLQPRADRPAPVLIGVQTVAAAAVIFVASQVFVRQLEWAGPQLGLSATVTALLLSPIATELPETMTALLWVRQGKTELALANISGAMMIQATVPSGLGLLFTSWHFDGPLIASGVVTMAAIGYLLVTFRGRRLSAGRLAAVAGFYAVFAASLVVL